MDDIVTRLRRKQHNDKELWCNSCEEFCCHCEICECCMKILDITDEAADEIERLRAEAEHLLHLWKVLMATVKAEEFANRKWIRGEIGAEELNLVATDRANAFNAFDMAVRGE